MALADVTMGKTAKKPSFPPVWFGFESAFGEQYALGKVLGQGSYGQVYSCVCKKDGKTYAVKVMDKMQIRNAEVTPYAPLYPPPLQHSIAPSRRLAPPNDVRLTSECSCRVVVC